MTESKPKNVLIVGAGFAGLAAAMELNKAGVKTTLCERQSSAGGLSQTIELAGIRFELGPHIYFDKDPDVTAFWHSLPGVVMSKHERKNRIFYNGKFIKSPLSIPDTLMKLGPIVVARILGSYALRGFAKREMSSAEDWVRSNFGAELFQRFFQVYNEKIWGIPCYEMAADWAGQRIKTSLATMLMKSVARDKNFIVKTFEFPVGGSKSIYQSQLEVLKKSPIHNFLLSEEPKQIRPSEFGYDVKFSKSTQGKTFSHVIWTGHLDRLLEVLDDGRTPSFKQLKVATSKLRYRSLVLLNFVFQGEDVRNFKEHWIDVHDPNIKALRVTNFSNYNTDHAKGSCGVGVEYNCWPEDEIWSSSDSQLQEMGLKDLQKMGLAGPKSQPLAFSALRLSRAYPVYFKGYQQYSSLVLDSLAKFRNLETAGRNALYKWNNMHHSVKTGILAARNVLGEDHDLLAVKGMVSFGKDSD
jgi:protoporphyrinogen oxidase